MKSSVWKNLSLLVVLVFSIFLVRRLYDNQRFLKEEISRVYELTSSVEEKIANQSKGKDQVVLPILKSTKENSWLEVQQKAKDTVVQVWVQISRFNWLEPYKSPAQGECTGTGFFINNKGHFITNYHVVDEAKVIQIKIPSLGFEMFEAEIIGVSPERDIALLKLKDDDFKRVQAELGEEIPFLKLGDSDSVLRTQEIMALGYPLSLPTLKSTQGTVSGRERLGCHSYLQTTAPLNPGNSGGPALDLSGEVIGINNAGIMGAQNMGYIIPISEVKAAINDLYKVKLLRRPLMGAIFTVSTKDLASYLGNPGGGGWYVTSIFEKSTLRKNGIREGDMIYEINGHKIDRFGEIAVPWSEDKVSVLTLLNRLVVGDDIHLVVYRNGDRKDIKFELEPLNVMPVRKIYPDFEKIDYEVIGGMVVMELTLNHAGILLERAPFLMNYSKSERQDKPKLIITNVLSNSQANKAQTLSAGSIIDEINGVKVSTLDEFRSAIKKSKKSGFLTVQAFDGVVDRMFAAMPIGKIIKDEDDLSKQYFYKKSSLIKDLS